MIANRVHKNIKQKHYFLVLHFKGRIPLNQNIHWLLFFLLFWAYKGVEVDCIEFIDQTNSKTCAAIKAVIKEDISEKKIKIAKIKEGIFSKSKIENLAKKSDLLDR